MRKTLTLLALLLALCLPLSCKGGDQGEQGGPSQGQSGEITVVFVPKITGNAFFESANKGAQEYAARHGFKVDYRGSPEASVPDQVAVVEQAIKDKVPAISISSLDRTALDDVLKKALDAGIVVTTWDSDVSGDARRIMVSQGTPSQLGRMLVEMGAKSLTKRGKNPSTDPIKYAWHYSQASVADQNSWREAGEEYIKSAFPNWENVKPDNYYSEQDPEKALSVGKEILTEHPDIDLIICNDSTSLPGQAQALKDMGKDAEDVSVTGFASPNAMKEFCREGIIDRWGLWDCQIQGAMACYISYYLASGNQLNVGQMVDIPEIGMLEVMPNTVLDPNMGTAPDSGVVLLPQRTEFTLDNMDDYDF
ncbi:MAG: substrate-binding domain-containing protein [Deltaproteobacteria bacterium]|jgi:AI-2 transport system substrate-binding protein|nr:substrate-binding domain-containing protein [Deltaproteobacteria bacterium]